MHGTNIKKKSQDAYFCKSVPLIFDPMQIQFCQVCDYSKVSKCNFIPCMVVTRLLGAVGMTWS